MLPRPQPSLQPPLPLVGGVSFSKVSTPQGPLPEHQLQLSTGRPWGWWAMCPSRPVSAPSGLPAQSPESRALEGPARHHPPWCLGSRRPRPAPAAAVPAPPSLTDLRFRGIGVRNPAWTPGSQGSSRGSLTRAHHHADPQFSSLESWKPSPTPKDGRKHQRLQEATGCFLLAGPVEGMVGRQQRPQSGQGLSSVPGGAALVPGQVLACCLLCYWKFWGAASQPAACSV